MLESDLRTANVTRALAWSGFDLKFLGLVRPLCALVLPGMSQELILGITFVTKFGLKLDLVNQTVTSSISRQTTIATFIQKAPLVISDDHLEEPGDSFNANNAEMVYNEAIDPVEIFNNSVQEDEVMVTTASKVTLPPHNRVVANLNFSRNDITQPAFVSPSPFLFWERGFYMTSGLVDLTIKNPRPKYDRF